MIPVGRDLVVIPVFNEGEKIEGVLKSVKEAVRGLNLDIAVVDDGSTDGSARAAKAESGVSLLSHGRNRGYGRALATGFGFALAGGYSRLVTLDCDEQHQPQDIPGFLEGLKEGDVLSGSRYLEGTHRLGLEAPEDRVRVNRVMTEEINALTGWSLTDTFCGMKAYRVEALRGIPIREDGYAMPLEFWVRAWKRGLRVSERPVDLIYNSTTRSFGTTLDDPEHRLKYYRSVIERVLSEEGSAA